MAYRRGRKSFKSRGRRGKSRRGRGFKKRSGTRPMRIGYRM